MKRTLSWCSSLLALPLGLCPHAATAQEGPVPVTLSYTQTNFALFQEIALPQDRLLYSRGQALNGVGWPPELSRGQVVTTWPSWHEAQQHEGAWAPHADVFGYDIEGDSPPEETQDVATTIQELTAYLSLVSQQYGHPIVLSAGLNYNFGTQHAVHLAQADEVHIHANELLRNYPAAGPHGVNYVEWSVARAAQVRAANPDVGIQLAVLTQGMEANLAMWVTEDLTAEMQAFGIGFQGFTTWADTDVLAAFLSWLRPATAVREGGMSAGAARIGPIYPNPSSAATTLRFAIPRRSHVLLKVFDAAGREVCILVDEELGPGEHSVLLEARGAPSGKYYCRLRAAASFHAQGFTVLR